MSQKQKIRARISGSDEDLGTFHTISVRGCTLSREFSEHEVDDETFGKLKGNPHVEVQVPSPGRAAVGKAGDAPAEPPSEKPAAEG